MAVPTLKEQRQTDIARFYDADLPNVESAETGAVDGVFLVRMEYPELDYESDEIQRDVAWARVLKSVWGQPAYTDVVTIAGTVWRVTIVLEVDLYQWKIKLEKQQRPNFQR